MTAELEQTAHEDPAKTSLEKTTCQQLQRNYLVLSLRRLVLMSSAVHLATDPVNSLALHNLRQRSTPRTQHISLLRQHTRIRKRPERLTPRLIRIVIPVPSKAPRLGDRRRRRPRLAHGPVEEAPGPAVEGGFAAAVFGADALPDGALVGSPVGHSEFVGVDTLVAEFGPGGLVGDLEHV